MKKHQIIMLMILFLFAFGIRLMYQKNTEIIYPLRGDSFKYYTIADNLNYKGIYSEKDGAVKPNYSITPGYPLYLAAIFKLSKGNLAAFYKTVQSSQAIMGAIIAVLAVLIAFHFLPFGFAYLTGVLTTLSPHLISLESYILTETLFTFLLMLALWALLQSFSDPRRILWPAITGLLFGSAALVRPAIILFPFFAIPLLLLSPQMRNWRTPAALLLATVISFGSWNGWKALHSEYAANSPSLLSTSMAMGIYPDLIYKNPHMKGYPYRDDPSYNNFAFDLNLTLQTLWERFQDKPIRYAYWYLAGKPAMFWSKNILVGQGGIFIHEVSRSLYDTNTFARGSLLIMQYSHPYLLFVVLAGFIGLGFIRPGKFINPERLNMARIIFMLLFYITLVHMALAPLPRYSIPFRPVLYISFATTLYFITITLKRILGRQWISA